MIDKNPLPQENAFFVTGAKLEPGDIRTDNEMRGEGFHGENDINVLTYTHTAEGEFSHSFVWNTVFKLSYSTSRLLHSEGQKTVTQLPLEPQARDVEWTTVLIWISTYVFLLAERRGENNAMDPQNAVGNVQSHSRSLREVHSCQIPF